MDLKTVPAKALIAFAVSMFAMAALPAGAGGQTATDSSGIRRTIVPDPAVRTGVLPNGLRFAIVHTSIPAHGLSLRLGIDVGSLEEQDTEQGFAHFIEHMAFRTTRTAPEGALDRRFSAFGIAFGRDQNAETTTLATTYRLDYANADQKGLDEGFNWLRDVGDGIVLSDAGIATERGVLLAERESRSTRQTAIRQSIARFQAAGAREADREPIGTPETLAAARPATLQAFYDRWYRPENAVLVVSGDQPVDVIEAKIRAAFGSWQGKGSTPPRAAPGRIDFGRGIASFSLAAPEMPSLVSVCRNRAPFAPDEPEMVRYTREVRGALWRRILTERLKTLVTTGHEGLLGADLVQRDGREFSIGCLIVVPIGDQWEKGLAAAQAELSRYLADGPSEAEVEAQVKDMRARLRGAINSADARTASDRANTMLGRLLDRRPILSPREEMHAFNVAIEDADPTMMKAVGTTQWSGSGPLLALVLPKPVDPAVVRTAWIANAARPPLPTFTDRHDVAWPYTDFGKAGTVVRREEIADPGFVRMRFANGVILNFKQTSLEPNDVQLRARFGAGQRELPPGSLLPATLATMLLPAGGLGKISSTDLQASLRDTGWEFNTAIAPTAFVMSSSTVKTNLSIMLQVFAAFMNDPGFRPEIDERLPGAVEVMFRMMDASPQMAVSEATLSAADPDSPNRIPPRETITRWRSADFDQLLRPALTRAPVELTIVGDVDEATATRLVAATFGALPPRAAADHTRPDARFTRFPEREFPVIRTTHGGPADQAAASLMWPLYVAEPARRREEYALKLLAGVFNDALRQRARVELGKTYSPTVATAMPDYADQGMLSVQIEGQPADIDLLVGESRALAIRLVGGAITQGDIDAVRTPLLAAAAAARSRNAWWAAAMDGSARTVTVTEEATNYSALMASITLDEVKAAAVKWLTRPAIVTVAVPRAAPPAAAAAKGKHAQ